MEEFLPSNIAKAVYGYLVSEGCHAAAKTFLETSPRLTECREWAQQGKVISNANTQLLGRNLVEVLNLALSAYSLVDHLKGKEDRLLSQSKEGAIKIYDEIRSFISTDSAVASPGVGAGKSQDQRSQDGEALTTTPRNDAEATLHTPPFNHSATPTAPVGSTSLADDYQSLVQQSLAEGFDSSLSSDKSQRFKTQVLSPPRQRTSSAPGSLSAADLLTGCSNQSAIDGIMAIPFDSPSQTQAQGGGLLAVTSASGPNRLTVTAPVTTSSNVVVTSASDAPGILSQCYSVPLPVVSCLPSSYSQPITDGTTCLPDPPIIVVKSQSEPFYSGDQTSFFGDQPNAASTPCPVTSTQLNPEDTACIIYPPVLSNQILKCSNSRRTKCSSGKQVVRKLLPKPFRKDPPNILHVQILSQPIEEEDEEIVDDPLAGNKEDLSGDQHVGTTESKSTGETINNNQKGTSPTDNLNAETPKDARPELKKYISRSTPRRNSHIRALNFNTPLKPIGGRKANTSPKMPKIRFSPRRLKINSVKRSSLFSPIRSKKTFDVSSLLQVEERQDDQGRTEKLKKDFNSPLSKVPIATRSPAQKLSSAWKEVNDVVITKKPVWDESIRNFEKGQFEDPAPPPKRQTKPKPKERESQKSGKEPSSKCNKKESIPRRSTRLNGAKEKTSEITEGVVPTRRHKQNKLKEINCKSKSGSSKSPLKKKNVLNQFCEKKKSVDNISNCKPDIVNSVCDETSNKVNVNGGKNNINPSSITGTSDENTQSHVKEKAVVKPVLSEEQQSQPTTVLVDDLVVSSNSLPSAGTSPENKKGFTKETQLPGEISFEKISSGSVEVVTKPGIPKTSPSSRSTFSVPLLPVLETPMKDIQNSTVPQTPVLNTPLLNTIRQDTSVLHEDLLLTPSLPPTPQVESGRVSTITPMKPVEATETTNVPTFKDTLNSKENHIVGEFSQISKQSNNASSVSNLVSQSNKTALAKSKVIVLDSSDSYSEGDSDDSSDGAPLIDPNDIPKIRTRIIQEGDAKSKFIKDSCEINGSKCTEESESGASQPSPQKRDDMSKLISEILEEEKKSLNNKPAKGQNKKRGLPKKPFLRKHRYDTTHSKVNGPVSPTQKMKTNNYLKRNKNSPETDNRHTQKFPPIKLGKNSVSKQSPEKIQLTLDLLRLERRSVFPDETTSSSDTDTEVFERKEPLVDHKKLKAPIPVKSQLGLSEESSSSAEVFERKEPVVEGKKFKAVPPKKPQFAVSDESLSSADKIKTVKANKSVSFKTTAQVHVIPEVSSSNSCGAQLTANEKGLKTADEQPSKGLLQVREEELIKAVEAITSSDTAQSSVNLSFETTENQDNNGAPQLFDDDNASCNYNSNNSPYTQKENNTIGSCDVAKTNHIPHATDTLSISCDSTLMGSFEETKTESITSSRQDSSYEEAENQIVIVSTTQKQSSNALCTSVFDPKHKEVYQLDENTVTTLTFSEMYVHLSPNLPRTIIKLTPVEPEVFELSREKWNKKAYINNEGVWQKGLDAALDKVRTTVNSEERNAASFSSKPVSSRNHLNSTEKEKRSLHKESPKPRSSILECADKREQDMSSRHQLNSSSPLTDSAKSKNDTSPISNPTFSGGRKESAPGASNKAQTSSIAFSSRSKEYLIKSNHKSPENIIGDDGKLANDKNLRVAKKLQHTSNNVANSSDSLLDRSGGDLTKPNRRSNENLNTDVRNYEDKRDDNDIDKSDYFTRRRQRNEHSDRITRRQLDRRKDRDFYPRRRESPRRKSNERYDYRERHCSSYQHERGRRDDYFEKRHNSSRNYSSRRDHSGSDHRRQDFKNHSDRFLRPGAKRSFSDRSNIKWKDLDKEGTPQKENTLESHSSKPVEILDPRVSAEVVRYSVEREQSWSNDTNGLMDYAVISSSRIPSSKIDQLELVKSTKRKSCDDGSPVEQMQEEKRSRLAKEVDMREAKSVLKHKMADMLNALHPIQQRKITPVEDNSNEVSS